MLHGINNKNKYLLYLGSVYSFIPCCHFLRLELHHWVPIAIDHPMVYLFPVSVFQSTHHTASRVTFLIQSCVMYLLPIPYAHLLVMMTHCFPFSHPCLFGLLVLLKSAKGIVSLCTSLFQIVTHGSFKSPHIFFISYPIWLDGNTVKTSN